MKKDKYLSKEYTNCLRGICAIVVVIHHLYLYTGLFSGTYIGKLLHLSGALAVSVFFFFSGYGLMFSSSKKDYVQNFIRNRFLPLYSFYVVLIILYSLWTLCIDRTLPPLEFVQSFFFGKTVVSNAWYLQATFVLYLIYYFSFSTFKSAKTSITAVAVGILCYCVFCRLIHLDIWWYQNIPCVILGMVYCHKKEQIDALLNKHAWSIFIASAVLFALFYIITLLYVPLPIFRTIFFSFFVCAVISFSYILCDTPIINNRFFALCGEYSLEIYVSHGFFLRLTVFRTVANTFVYVLAVILGTIITSLILKKIRTKVIPLLFRNKVRIPN